MLSQMESSHSFLWPIIFHCIHTRVSLSMHPSIDTYVVSIILVVSNNMAANLWAADTF